MNEDLEEVTARVPRPLVIDLGTYTTKIGYAPQDFGAPNDTFP